jgi:carbonic anhydrase
MKSFNKILEDNKDWAAQQVVIDPDYFNRLSNIQKPDFLWIGCSDSRVPADKITATQPGEIFVHRNIANMVVHTDVNLLSVLDFAVSHLKVKHVIVCGHYGCGGIKAAMENRDYRPVLNMWLRNIKDVYHMYADELNAIEDQEKRTDRLVELNVKEQVLHLAQTTIIQRAWKQEQAPDLHGWVYGLKDGIIKPVFDLPAGSEIDPLYKYDNL